VSIILAGMKDKKQKDYSVSKDLEDRMKDHPNQPLFGKDSPFSELPTKCWKVTI
jgi:hypothetical protein